MDDLAILTRAADQGITLHAAWVNEWTKRRGQRRGHHRRRLKYYWMEHDLLHSGPFTSQAEAILYLAQNQDKDLDHDY